MTQRIAAALALIVFAVCLGVGAAAGNPLVTVMGRAMLAMIGTLVIGLFVGAMARRMLEENLKPEEEKIKNDSAKEPPTSR
jgi:NhaP-type Na+/H+ or K+/H+ antiporter